MARPARLELLARYQIFRPPRVILAIPGCLRMSSLSSQTHTDCGGTGCSAAGTYAIVATSAVASAGSLTDSMVAEPATAQFCPLRSS